MLLGARSLWESVGAPPGSATLSGVTRTCAGAVLGSVTVLCFRTSDNLLIGTTVSDGSGTFSITVTAGESHYLVGYLVNAPDTFGTTRNDLQGV